MSLIPEIKPGQSLELLKELHILTRDGKINQDSRRKLKQVYHLYQFIEPLLNVLKNSEDNLTVVDHGAGKSYLGFILYDLFFKSLQEGRIYGIETREELVIKSQELARKLGFPRMSFLNLSVEESTKSSLIPESIGMVTALHACNTTSVQVSPSSAELHNGISRYRYWQRVDVMKAVIGRVQSLFASPPVSTSGQCTCQCYTHIENTESGHRLRTSILGKCWNVKFRAVIANDVKAGRIPARPAL